MIKATQLFCPAAVCVMPSGLQAAPPPNRVIDCGTDKVVCFDGTRSPDSRYAIGWTLRPVGKDAKPVDWSSYDPEDRFTFLDKYDSDLDFDQAKHPYRIDDCVIDLQAKKILDLPSDEPYFPRLNHHLFISIPS